MAEIKPPGTYEVALPIATGQTGKVHGLACRRCMDESIITNVETDVGGAFAALIKKQ
jgi:hypothetical protein